LWCGEARPKKIEVPPAIERMSFDRGGVGVRGGFSFFFFPAIHESIFAGLL
jgi:hypothetical protein